MDLTGVDVLDLVEKIGLNNAHLTSGGKEVNFDCFGPEHRDGGSAYINIETSAWFCHGCKRRGNAINLVMEVHQVDRPEAERFLREQYGLQFAEPVGGSMVAETEARLRPPAQTPDPVPPPAGWLSSVRVDWAVGPYEPYQQYLLGRGFMPAVLADWDIGYDYMSDRLTIPVFDIDGRLVGLKGRAWLPDVKPKYRVLGDVEGMARYGFTPYQPDQVIFGLHRARTHRTAVLFEGELNAIAASQLGIPRPVATGMSYFTARHAQLLGREVDEVIIYYDYGQAGLDGTWGRVGSDGRFYPGAVQLMEPYARVRVVEPLPDDPSKLVELGRGHEVIELVENAQSVLLHANAVFR